MCMGSRFQKKRIQKRVLRLIYDFTLEMSISLLIKSAILPITMIYFETIANLMHEEVMYGSASPLRVLFLK